MPDYFSYTLSGNLSGQLINLRMTGGRLTIANGCNLAGAIINVEIANVDESLTGGVISGRIVGAKNNRCIFNVIVTASLGEYHAIEAIMDISGRYADITISGDIGGTDTINNAIRVTPTAYTTWPVPSSTDNTYNLAEIFGGNEEKFCYDSYARGNFIRSGWITAIDSVNNTVTVGTNGYIRLTGGSFSGMHLAINVTASVNEANNGKCYELASGDESAKIFALAAGETTEGLTVGDFVSIGSMLVDNVITGSVSEMPHGMGAVLFAGCYRNIVRDFVADVPDGTYPDINNAQLPNKGVGAVGLISSIATSSNWAAMTASNTSYMGSADNMFERCYVTTNKSCQYNLETIVNRDYDSAQQDYRLDHLPAGMPKMLGYRNRLIDCRSQHVGADAALGIWDQRNASLLWNDLPANRSATFAIVAGVGDGPNTYTVDICRTFASRNGDRITLDADPGASSTLYGWDEDPTTPYAGELTVPVAAAELRYRSTMAGWPDEPIRTLGLAVTPSVTKKRPQGGAWVNSGVKKKADGGQGGMRKRPDGSGGWI